MSLALGPYDVPTTNAHLRMEPGWYEVQKALWRILLGYLIMVFGVVVGVAVIFMVIGLRAPDGPAWSVSQINQIAVMAGLGVVTIGGALGYMFIITGHWGCLMGTPDRLGARWLIFASLLCLVAGPVLNFTSGFADTKKKPGVIESWRSKDYLISQRELDEWTAMDFGTPQGYMRLIGSVMSYTSLLLFILFLRAIARCFEDRARMWLANLYLLFMIGLSSASLFLSLVSLKLLFAQPLIIVALGVGWLIAFIWYLLLVASVRVCVAHGMKHLPTPYEENQNAPVVLKYY
jgi:hypothetical protein